ncbi:hypothetical protein F511_13830 [Dorcoceras hygrometricum]|uniref:Uncharacterized protein n=1 Tax=Dorcoceras hygrometricum TaxID=472368 RepID=A0A2Z7C1F5_9LAMI|nr:hypothetical protein F511_13830 [Dorcoceras hygrometricum]
MGIGASQQGTRPSVQVRENVSLGRTDSLAIAIHRRLFIIAKYIEVLLRQYFEARHTNLVTGLPTTAIDQRTLDLLSAAHQQAVRNLLRQIRAHGLKWTRPILDSALPDFSVQISPVVDSTSPHTDFVLSSPHQSPSSASSMRFTDDILQGTETAVEQILEPVTATATDINAQFAQLRDSISQISIKQVRTHRSLDDLKSELLFKIDNLAKASAEARDQRTQHLQNSIKSVRQEGRTQSDVLTVKLNEYHKGTRAHHALVTTELEDIRKEVKAMDEHLSTIRSEMLDFRAQAQENHLNLSTQLGFLVDYINRGGDAKKGEGGSSRPQPPPDDQSRPSWGSGGRGSGGDGSSQRRGSGGSSKKRHSVVVHHSSGGGGSVGPIIRDVEYWISGKRQF